MLSTSGNRKVDQKQSSLDIAQLQSIDAVDESGLTTLIGYQLEQFPMIDPRFARMILMSMEPDHFLLVETVAAVACMSIGDIFVRNGSEEQKNASDVAKSTFSTRVGDPLTYLLVFDQWKRQLRQNKHLWCEKNFIDPLRMQLVADKVVSIMNCLRCAFSSEHINLRRSPFGRQLQIDRAEHWLTYLFFRCFRTNIAIYSGNTDVGYYSPAIDDYVTIHPSSALNYCGVQPEWIVYEFVFRTRKSTRNFVMNVCIGIDKWLRYIDEATIRKCYDMRLHVHRIDTEYGPTAKREVYYRRQQLIDWIHPDICHFEYRHDDPWQRMSVSVLPRAMLQLRAFFAANIDPIVDGLRRESRELLSNNNSATVVHIRAGGLTTELLMPGEYCSVLVRPMLTTNVYSVADIYQHYSQFGTITHIKEFDGHSTWGRIRFGSSAAAIAAVAAPNCELLTTPFFEYRRSAAMNDKASRRSERVQLRISWARRISRCTAVITLNCSARQGRCAKELLARELNARGVFVDDYCKEMLAGTGFGIASQSPLLPNIDETSAIATSVSFDSFATDAPTLNDSDFPPLSSSTSTPTNSSLTPNDSVYSCRTITSKATKKTSDSNKEDCSSRNFEFFLYELPEEMSRPQLNAEIDRILAPYRIRIVRVILLHSRPYPVESIDQLRSFESTIGEKLRQCGASATTLATIRVCTPKSQYCYNHHAWCEFSRAIEAEQVFAAINRRPFMIANRKARVSLRVHLTIPISKSIYRLMETELRTIETSPNVRYSVQTTSNGGVFVSIDSNNYRDALNLQTQIDQLIRGDILDCNNNANDGAALSGDPTLIAPLGLLFLKSIEHKHRVIVNVSHFRSCVRIIGTKCERDKARAEIDAYINNKSACIFSSELLLLPPTYRRGTLRALLRHYRNSIDALVADIDANCCVQIDCDKHRLVYRGAADGYEKLLTIVRDVSMTVVEQTRDGSSPPDCSICLCASDDTAYCLESCGHYCCRECIITQLHVAIQTRQYPIVCVQCTRPLVWKDFEHLIVGDGIHGEAEINDRLKPLIDSSLAHYMASHANQYRFCITVDCNGVYAVASVSTTAGASDVIFECDLCGCRQCRRCGTEAHDGLTCVEYGELTGDVNASLTHWLREDARNRRLCPNIGCRAPIEKHLGCNHMECANCKIDFCWLCAFIADTSEKIYVHLREVHGEIDLIILEHDMGNLDIDWDDDWFDNDQFEI